MTTPFITLNAGSVTAQLDKAKLSLQGYKEKALAAAGSALDQAGEAMLADAQAAAPVATGALQASGTTQPVVIEGTSIVKRWGFNSKYARMRDQGGTIVPVRARMLAIPLSDEAKKMASPLEMGGRLRLVPINGRLFLIEKDPKGQGKVFQRSDLRNFHWMLVPRVEQEGNQFATKTANAWKDQLPRFVADEVRRAIGGGA